MHGNLDTVYAACVTWSPSSCTVNTPTSEETVIDTPVVYRLMCKGFRQACRKTSSFSSFPSFFTSFFTHCSFSSSSPWFLLFLVPYSFFLTLLHPLLPQKAQIRNDIPGIRSNSTGARAALIPRLQIFCCLSLIPKVVSGVLSSSRSSV